MLALHPMLSAVLHRTVPDQTSLLCAALRCAALCCAGLGWAGLGWAGLCSVLPKLISMIGCAGQLQRA